MKTTTSRFIVAMVLALGCAKSASSGDTASAKDVPVTGADAVDAAAADPGSADPGLADLGAIDPGMEDPGASDPGLADPGADVADDPGNPADIATDVPPLPHCCTKDDECPAGERCEEAIGGCVPLLPAGDCWTDEDCAADRTCVGAYLCPCSGGGHSCGACAMACQQDRTGKCHDLVSQGCCRTSADCANPSGSACAGKHDDAYVGPEWGVCVDAAVYPRCWTDTDCKQGEACHDPALCDCMMDCDMAYEGPGVCAPAGEACVAVQPKVVKEWCDAASVVVWDGWRCVATCPGCCECWPFCDFIFESVAACEAACPVVAPDPCDSHDACGPDRLCFSLDSVQPRACGLCGVEESCGCLTPVDGLVECATDLDCSDSLVCGDKCDDCPPCPPCIHGFCIHPVDASPECICTGCA